jgi:hypothetical protein
MDEFRTIKKILTRAYNIEMFQDKACRYRICYESRGVTRYSEWITDYSTASYMFDLKLQELEGS